MISIQNILKAILAEAPNELEVAAVFSDYLQDANNILHLPVAVNEMVSINIQDIVYLRKDGYATSIKLIDKHKITTKLMADDLFEYLDKYQQFNVLDRNLMVNLSQVASYHSYLNTILTKNGETVCINGTCMKYLKKLKYLEDQAKEKKWEYSPVKKRGFGECQE